MGDPVLGHITLQKPAMQSSTYYLKGFNYTASLAVDGNADPGYRNRNCSFTTESYDPWWAVDLERRYTVLNISLTSANWGGMLEDKSKNLLIHSLPLTALLFISMNVCA